MMQLRGLMYVGFAFAVLATWFINRRKRSQHQAQIKQATQNLTTPETLEEALKHTRWKVRAQAIEQLQERHDAEALGHLIKLLNDPVNDIREMTVSAIVPYGNQALGDLALVIDTGALNAREAAVKTLCEIGTPETVDLLVIALQDESAWVRISAIRGLSAIGGERARQALESARTDTHPDVVKAVKEALLVFEA